MTHNLATGLADLRAAARAGTRWPSASDRSGTARGPRLVLAFDDCRLAVRAPANLAATAAGPLAPFVTRVDNPDGTDVSVTIELIVGTAAGAEPVAEVLRAQAERVPVDASLYPTNTDGLRLADETGTAVLVESTGTVCWFTADEPVVRLYATTPETAITDLSRVIKNLLTAWGERTRGLFLHASAVLVDGRAVLLPADSRNGKTSLLLELLTRADCTMVSCDTVLLRQDGDLPRICGWPSNFSVSVGTVYDFPALMPLLDSRFRGLTYSQAWAHYPKEVLSTADVLERLGTHAVTAAPLDSTVFAIFDPARATGLTPLGDAERVRTLLRPVTLGSLDPLYPNWLGYWHTPPQELGERVGRFADWLCAGARTYELAWAPGPLQLLRHVPLIDQAFQMRLRDESAGGGAA